MPEIEAAAEVVIAHIGLDPIDRRRGLAEAVACLRQGGRRDVGDGDVRVARCEQLPGEPGGAAADVEDGRVAVEPGGCDQLQ